MKVIYVNLFPICAVIIGYFQVCLFFPSVWKRKVQCFCVVITLMKDRNFLYNVGLLGRFTFISYVLSSVCLSFSKVTQQLTVLCCESIVLNSDSK